MSYGMEYSLGQFGLAVVVVCSPTLLPTPSLLASGAEWEEGLDNVPTEFSSNNRIDVL